MVAVRITKEDVPEFYKKLGPFAMDCYMRAVRKGKSTKHWSIPYGDYKFVFFDDVSPSKVQERIRSVRQATGQQYPWDPVLNMWSLNKPLNREFRR